MVGGWIGFFVDRLIGTGLDFLDMREFYCRVFMLYRGRGIVYRIGYIVSFYFLNVLELLFYWEREDILRFLWREVGFVTLRWFY